MKWIKTDDQMPVVGVPVLVYWGESDIGIEIDFTDINVDDGTRYFDNAGEGVQPTHWMPLPELPTD